MSNATKEYVEARTIWVQALKNETIAQVELKAARYKFVNARDNLRAEEKELLENKVLA